MFKRKISLFLIPMLLVSALAFAYTRDWDNTDPIDHSLNSTWPAEIREVMTDVAERLDSWVYGFTSGETNEGLKRAPLIVQSSDPGATANTAWVYSKDVDSTAEVYIQDEAGNVIQLTDSGSINITQAQVCSNSYPVGSIYIATVSTDPSTLLGCGTWAAFGTGRVLVGIDSGDTDFDTAEETGGAKTHTITTDEMPAHTHTVVGRSSRGTNAGPNTVVETNDNNTTITSSSAGGGTAMSIMNPYIVVYMWERTA